jgi:bacterioferritin (cytochrome b1)
MGLYTLMRKGNEDILILNRLLSIVAVAFCHYLTHRPPYTNAGATNLNHTALTDAFKKQKHILG